jgi:hypothetical protein
MAGATGLETETLGHQGELRGKMQVLCSVGFPFMPLNTPELAHELAYGIFRTSNWMARI